MRTAIPALLLGAAIALAPLAPAWAEDYVIVVNKANTNAVDTDFAARAFRGEAKSWPGGGNVATLALAEANPTRVAFDKAVLGKTPAQTRAMWAQLTFSGKAVPPKILDSDDDVLKVVAENKNALGYVSPKANVSGVRAVH